MDSNSNIDDNKIKKSLVTVLGNLAKDKFNDFTRASLIKRNLRIDFCLKCYSKVIKEKDRIICPRCNSIFTYEEYELVNQRCIIMDFSNHKLNSLQLVFDHHNPNKNLRNDETATTLVVDFINIIFRKENRNQAFITSDFYFKLSKALQNYINSTSNKINIFTNHIDIDSIISVFSFKFPMYAIKYGDLLKELSLAGDLNKISRKSKRIYMTILGYLIECKLNKESDLEKILKTIKLILDNPERFKKYFYYERNILKAKRKKLDKSKLKIHNKIIFFESDTLPTKKDYSAYLIAISDFLESNNLNNTILFIVIYNKIRTPICNIVNSKENKREIVFDKIIETEIIQSISLNPNHPDFLKTNLFLIGEKLNLAEFRAIEEVYYKLNIKMEDLKKYFSTENYTFLKGINQRKIFQSLLKVINNKEIRANKKIMKKYLELLDLNDLSSNESRSKLCKIFSEIYQVYTKKLKKIKQTIKANKGKIRFWLIKPNLISRKESGLTFLTLNETLEILKEYLK